MINEVNTMTTDLRSRGQKTKKKYLDSDLREQNLNLACFTSSKINGERHHFIMQLKWIIQKMPDFSSNIQTQISMLRIGTMIHLYINVPIMVIWRFVHCLLNMEPFWI